MNDLQKLHDRVLELERVLKDKLYVSISSVVPQAFVGQLVTLRAQVRNTEGVPRRQVPVTFQTSWGLLRTVHNLATVQGTSVTTTTNSQGVAVATLLPGVIQAVSKEQQSILESTLQKLDVSAPSPLFIRDGLNAIAQEYRLETHVELRRAIDIYFKALQLSFLGSNLIQDALTTWNHINVVVTAHARTEGSLPLQGQTQGSSSMTMQLLDWLNPFLQLYFEQQRTENKLNTDFDIIKDNASKPGEVADGVVKSVQTFLSREKGKVGEFVGQQVASDAVEAFITSGFKDLNSDTKVKLFPALQASSNTITNASQDALNEISQAKIDLRNEIEEIASLQEASLKELVTTTIQETLPPELDDSIQAILPGKVDQSLTEQLPPFLEENVPVLVTDNALEIIPPLASESIDSLVPGKVETELNAQIEQQLPESIDNLLPDKIDAIASTIIEEEAGQHIDALLPSKIDDSLPEKIDSFLPSKIDAVLPGHIDETLPGHIDALLPGRIDEILPKHIDETLPGHIDKILPAHIDQVLPEHIDKILPGLVDNILPGKVKDILDEVLDDLVDQRIDEVLEEKISRILPDLVKEIVKKHFDRFKKDIKKHIDRQLEKWTTQVLPKKVEEIVRELLRKILPGLVEDIIERRENSGRRTGRKKN